MVRLICFLFSIYILALAGKSCSDTLMLNEDFSVQTSISNQDHKDAHPTSDWDGCQPLCICNCCHVNVILSTPIQFSHPEDFHIFHVRYLRMAESIPLASFLKPPIS